MSAISEQLEGVEDEVCASCGIAAIDNITLKKCACNLVKYCSVDCQKNHRPQHKKLCKKRLAEMHDDDLFEQPDTSHLGECPLCCLPPLIDIRKSTMMGCCSKIICNGCSYANQKREVEARLEHRCAFCREPAAQSDEESRKQLMERIKKYNDPAAMAQMGGTRFKEGDYDKAFEYFTKAAELGDADARYRLGSMYFYGNGVEKDEKKAIHHLEKAAIGGHTAARGILGTHEKNKGRLDRAAKHFIINANLGCNTSLKCIKDLFVNGAVSKEEYTAALRGYQSAVDAAKSPEREIADFLMENGYARTFS